MLTTLAVVTVAAALLGMLYATILKRGSTSRWQTLATLQLRPLLVLAIVAAVALFLCTVPTGKPFGDIHKANPPRLITTRGFLMCYRTQVYKEL